MSETDETEAVVIPRYSVGLRARGERLWREMRRIVRAAGSDARVTGYKGQPASLPDADDLRKSQSNLLSMLKSIRVVDDTGDRKLPEARSAGSQPTRGGAIEGWKTSLQPNQPTA